MRMQRKGREMSDDLVRRLRGERVHFLADIDIRLEAADRIEQLEAAINAALERLDASLFTNAEHQQAKDILREVRK